MKRPDLPKSLPKSLTGPLTGGYRRARAGIAGRRRINSGDGSRQLSFTLRGRSITLGQADPVTYGLAAALFILLLAVLIGGGNDASGATEETTTEAARGVVEQTSTGSGSIESARDTDLSFETSGTVTEVFVEEGERVKKGDPIAKLDRRSAKLAVEVAEANLEAAEDGTGTTTGVSYRQETGEGQTVTAAYTGGTRTILVATTDEAATQAATGESEVVCADGETAALDDTGTTICIEAATGPTGATGATGATGPSGPVVVPETDGTEPEVDTGIEAPATEGVSPATGGAVSGGSISGVTGGGTSSSSTSETA